MSSQYDVQVKLSTVGQNEVKSNIGNIKGVLDAMQTSLNNVEGGTRRLSATFRQADADGNKYSITMRQLAESKQRAASSADHLSGSISKLGSALVGLYATVQLGGGIKSFLDQGVELNALLETSRLGIAATIVSYREFYDAQGNAIKGTAAMNLAMRESAQVQKLLQSEAFNTTATLEQMLKAYQQLQIGATAQKASSAELATFTSTLGNFATASGRSFEELSAQTSRVLQGVLTIRNPIVALLRGMGVDNATIKSWVDQGVAVKNIQEKLIEFMKIGPEINKTWTGVKSNVQDVVQQMSGVITGPAMDAIKSLGIEFVGMFTTVREIGGRKVTSLKEDVVVNARIMGEALRFAFEGFASVVSRVLGIFKTDTSMRDGVLEIATAMAKLKSIAGEVAELLSIMAKTSLVPLQAALGLNALSVGDLVTAKEKFEWGQKLIAQNVEYTMGMKTRSAEVARALAEDMKKIKDAMEPRPGDYSFMGPIQPSDNGQPKNRPLDAAIQGTITQYKDFKALIESKFDLGGLTGLDKALASNEVQFNQNIKTIDAWATRLNKMSARELSAAGITNVKGEIEGLKAGAAQQRFADDAKAMADSERKVADAYARMGKLASDTAEDQIEASRQVKQAQLADFVEIIAANEKTEAGMLALIKAFNVEKQEINDQAARQRTERFENEMSILRDELSAVTRDSYTRDLAEIQKSLDVRIKNIEKVYGAESDLAKEEIALAQQVADARKALVLEERDSIIGYRKTAEDEAKKIILSTDSIAGGFALGLQKMKATVVSATEAVGDFVAGVWSNLGQAFETGFYDVLTGKFDDLKDVLASLWDSILKDFSKMLTQMLTRWLLTGKAMGEGQSSGGLLSGLLGGGSSAVYTPQGTGVPGSTFGTTQYGDYIGGGEAPAGGQKGGGLAGYAGVLGGVAMAGYGLYGGISSLFAADTTSTPTYQGQSLGQTANFGGPGGGALAAGGLAVAAGTLVAAQAAVTVGLLTAAAASAATVVGLIVAAALVIAAVLVEIFSGKEEGHIHVAMSDAFEKAGARSAVGNFVSQIIDSTAGFVGELAMQAAGPEGVGKYVAAYQNAFKDMYGKARFDFAAGSPEDLQKDVEQFFKVTLPTMAMRAAFGQIGYDPHGNRDAAGGMAGMDWTLGNPALMDKDGNWVKKQLYDPNAPIPMMLTGLGFSADAITEIAQKLASGVDIEQFKKNLMDLVTVVAGFADLGEQLGRSASEWREFFGTRGAQKGTAAEFTTGISNLTGRGQMLESLVGDERIAAAKQLLQDSGALLDQLATALQSIFTMIDNIQKSTADTIESYRNKLLSPAQLESQARDNVATGMAAIADAANPAEVQAAWQQVMKDLSAVLDAIVARIQSIKALQQSYADFRTQMGRNAGPQFADDPTAWLRQNGAAIDAVTKTLATATGNDAITNAQKLLTLTQERYNNELQMLQRVNAAIASIQETHDTTNQNLEMQGMGSVVDGKWVPDVHAQGDYLEGKYDDLMAQLASAQTPEEVQRIYGKMQGIISQLAAQPQDPSNYAESRRTLQGMNDESTRVAQELLKKWGKDLETDLAGTGDLLAAGEEALAAALAAAEEDFDTNLGLMSDAAAAATAALDVFAGGIITMMTELGRYMDHWAFVMSHAAGEKDPNWDYGENKPGAGGPTAGPDVWVDDPNDSNWEICISGPNKDKRRRKPGTALPRNGPDSPTAPPPVFTANVTVNSGSPEEIAQAAADAVYEQTLRQIKQNNVELVRVIRNNPSLISTGA